MFAFEIEFQRLKDRLNDIIVSSAFPKEDIEKMELRIDELKNQVCKNPHDIMKILNCAQSEYEEFLDGRTPDASFHLVADTHITGEKESADEWEKALCDMKNIFPERNIGFVSAGDMTACGKMEQYRDFYESLKKVPVVPDDKMLILLGNHDVRGWESKGWSRDPHVGCEMWPMEREEYVKRNAPYMPEYAKEKLYHSKEIGGYTFLMLNTTVGIKDAMWMTDEMIEWFESEMKTCYEKDPTKPVFIVAHQPLNNTHWRSNVLEGFDGLGNDIGNGPNGKKRDYSNNADEKVKEIMEKYPVGIFLSGHIHNQFGLAEVQIRKYGIAVDIPSFGQPELGIPDRGTGFEVEIFKDQLIFRARNFASRKWLPQYDTVISLPLIEKVIKDAEDIGADEKSKALIDEAKELMERTYDQEGVPWNWHGMPTEILFDREAVEKIEGIRKEIIAKSI